MTYLDLVPVLQAATNVPLTRVATTTTTTTTTTKWQAAAVQPTTVTTEAATEAELQAGGNEGEKLQLEQEETERIDKVDVDVSSEDRDK